MKISVIATSTGWHSDQLLQASKKRGVEIEVLNIDSINNIKSLQKSLGDVIIWRSASISPSMDRTIFFNILKDKHIINHSIVQPLLAYKLYQQKVITGKTTINGIPTFKFKNKKEVLDALEVGILKYPFIQKPNLGSKGEGVVLIRNESDLTNQSSELKIKEQVYQNFIKNNGDYRILMLGGKALGVMRRIAADGSFLNNISRGGTAEKVEDEEIIKEVTSIARTVAATLDLTFCGVDVIRNEETGEFHFLEVNTAPQWEGFQKTFPEINVADHIIDLCIGLGNRGKKKTHMLVKEYYDSNYAFLAGKQFHYASRMWLWTKEDSYFQKLQTLKSKYVGANLEETESKILEDLNKNEYSSFKNPGKQHRLKYFDKYPELTKFNPLLFYTLFCDTIYNTNIRTILAKHISDEKFLEMAEKIQSNEIDFYMLSTRAVNFLYLLDFYFQGKKQFLNPEKYLQIAKNNDFADDKLTNISLKIYLLTHCIIGASKFYIEKVQGEIYKEMCLELEKIIAQNYFSTSMDSKLEFLVCCKLCDYKSSIEEIIQDEANNSLSKTGNFVVDTLNLKARPANYQFPMSEHRNVLFLMGNLDFTNHKNN
jgi:RimK family alpha-L-glutamate ligase